MQITNLSLSGGVTFTGAAPAGDQYWANVSYLSETTSTNAQTNNTFLDSSSAALSISRFGSPTQGSVTPFTVASGSSYSTATNGGSVSFAGGGEYLKSAASAGLSFNGDFTIECWVKTSTISLDPYYRRVWSFSSGLGSNYLEIGFYGSTAISFSVVNEGSITGTIAVADGNWHHVAVTRSGSSIKLFVDGVQSGSTFTSSTNFTDGATNGMYISSLGGVGGYLVGNISSLRVVKGTAVYTSAFTPPTSPLTAISGTSLLLNFTNAGMYDAAAKSNLTSFGTAQASTTQAKWSPTSAYFNGTSDYLSAPNNAAFDFGTGDFTIEGWFYLTGDSAVNPGGRRDATIIGCWSDVAANNDWNVFLIGNGSTTGTGIVLDSFSGGAESYLVATTTITKNVWTHFAVVKQSSNVVIYINGASVGSKAYSAAVNSGGSALRVASLQQGAAPRYYNYFPGYLQDLRVTKGVARYTATFTPPTAAFPTSA
jgi:hypothetical protein